MTNLLRSLLGVIKASCSGRDQLTRFVGLGYPKTGNTWTRIMLGHYVKTVFGLDHLLLFDQAEMEELVSNGYRGPVGVFTHGPLVWDRQTAADLDYDNTVRPFIDQRVVFLTRHPLDVLVSQFMHAKFKARKAPYLGRLQDFVTDPVHGLDKFLRFHELWARHHSEVRAFMLWRYEDVRVSPEEQLKRLLAFLGLQADSSAVSAAVKFASFENLKAMEAAGERLVYRSSGFNAFGDGPRDDPNAFHIRKGQVGGYRDELSPELTGRLEERLLVEMPAFFGY
jgi:hypothetical protein